MTEMREPVSRGALRMWLGTRYFRARRRLWWHTGGTAFAKKRTESACPCLCAEHATPLMRKLKDVDMWMQENKVKNLRLAAGRLDGLTLLPGETLSYWRAIGNPTRRRGYVEGMLLQNGTVVPGVGGRAGGGRVRVRKPRPHDVFPHAARDVGAALAAARVLPQRAPGGRPQAAPTVVTGMRSRRRAELSRPTERD